MSELTAKDLHWFKLANSNAPAGFYDFKRRFLKRFADRDGYDLQTIDLVCHGCDGSGLYEDRVVCYRCSGTGIYGVREHWLARWNLAGRLYHCPEDHATVWRECGHRYPEPVRTFEGRIKHGEVSGKAADRSYARLLLRHEPVNYYNRLVLLIKDRAYFSQRRWAWRLIRLRNKLDLFPAVDQDVPF
jgi:hypothetical protein